MMAMAKILGLAALLLGLSLPGPWHADKPQHGRGWEPTQHARCLNCHAPVWALGEE